MLVASCGTIVCLVVMTAVVDGAAVVTTRLIGAESTV